MPTVRSEGGREQGWSEVGRGLPPMGDGTQLAVRELLAEPTLNLRLIAGESAIDRAVRGIHLSDLRDPTPWMMPATVLLTTGPTFASDADVGVRLLERLAEIESPALGIATGYHTDVVPGEMVDRAEDLKLAVFEVPYGVAYRAVVDYVYHALASTDLHRMRRLVAVQNRLLELMVDERDAGDLLQGVASLLVMPLTLFDRGGTVVAQAGNVADSRAHDRLWRSYATASGGVGPLGMVESAHSRYYFREITMLGRVERVLASAVSLSADTEFVEMSLAFLQRLLALDLLRQREELLTARRIRSRLLQDFLSTRELPPEELALRMEREGIDRRSFWRITACELSEPRSGGAARKPIGAESEDRLIAAVERFVGERRVTFLGHVVEHGVVVLSVFADRDVSAARGFTTDLRSVLQEALKPLRVYVGCSSGRTGFSGGARALHEAEEALTLARRQPDGAVSFDEIRGRYRVIDGQSDATLKDIYERTVARLAEIDAREHTRLLETLAALLDNQLAMQGTADALYIHRNTLQKRLRRIERLLDVHLDRLDDVVELYLGLRAAELLGKSN